MEMGSNCKTWPLVVGIVIVGQVKLVEWAVEEDDRDEALSSMCSLRVMTWLPLSLLTTVAASSSSTAPRLGKASGVPLIDMTDSFHFAMRLGYEGVFGRTGLNAVDGTRKDGAGDLVGEAKRPCLWFASILGRFFFAERIRVLFAVRFVMGVLLVAGLT